MLRFDLLALHARACRSPPTPRAWDAVRLGHTAPLGGGGAYALSILALLALGLSFSLAVRALLQPGAKEAGPTLTAMRRAREAEDARAFEDSLLDDLEEDIEANEGALARKTLLFKGALTFLAFAILVELAGQVVQ